jgi:hypothetical protein
VTANPHAKMHMSPNTGLLVDAHVRANRLGV